MRRPSFLTPNFLTLTRLLLTPFAGYTLFIHGGNDPLWQVISWWIFFILGLSDIYDGRLARSANQITELGKFLDPVADKALIGTAMICLAVQDRFPWWIVIVILTREIGITLLRLSIIKRGVIPANRGGKIKALMQNFGVGFFILPLPSWLFWFRDGFIYIAVILTIVTGFHYVRSAMRNESNVTSR